MLRKLTVRLAMSALGIPYIWGGAMLKEGFDCSGFIVWLFQVVGVLRFSDYTAQQLRNDFAPLLPAHESTIQPGDLAFYGQDQSHVTHIMLCINHLTVLGASGGDHTVKDADRARAIGASVHTRDLNYRRDLLGIGHVTYPDET